MRRTDLSMACAALLYLCDGGALEVLQQAKPRSGDRMSDPVSGLAVLFLHCFECTRIISRRSEILGSNEVS
jgi:hypothetical protein